MCGEHMDTKIVQFPRRGSSPHVRGAPDDGLLRHLHEGIIPACAGSTGMAPPSCGFGGDHPRMCGEHLALLETLDLIAGSSPHVRGARRMLMQGFADKGIIPACAGSTHP